MLCRHLAASFLLWPEEPFRRRKPAKHVVHKANNMPLHFGWTRGANKVVFGENKTLSLFHWVITQDQYHSRLHCIIIDTPNWLFILNCTPVQEFLAMDELHSRAPPAYDNEPTCRSSLLSPWTLFQKAKHTI